MHHPSPVDWVQTHSSSSGHDWYAQSWKQTDPCGAALQRPPTPQNIGSQEAPAIAVSSGMQPPRGVGSFSPGSTTLAQRNEAAQVPELQAGTHTRSRVPPVPAPAFAHLQLWQSAWVLHAI